MTLLSQEECAMQGDTEVFDDYKKHSDARRISTDLVVKESLRQSYPYHHVTCVTASACELLDYAKGGNAEVEEVHDDEDRDVTIRYEKVGRRLDNHPGKLSDDVHFGRYRYSWNASVFLVYKLEYVDNIGRGHRYFYVLAPREENKISAGRCESTDALLLAAGKWSSQVHQEIYVFDAGYWSKSHALFEAVQGSSWDEVIMDRNMKDSLIADVQGFFDSRDLYKEFAVPWKRGIIFHGVPGNGKTISIRALMNSLAARSSPIPSLYVKSFDACQGPQFSIRQIFAQARAVAPCLLIFEDLDSLVTEEVRSYFLNEVDGLESNDGILMIGSTNHLDNLDPAISKRPSRFDRKVHYKLPGHAERDSYAKFWQRKLANNQSIDFPTELCPVIADLSKGFSFAYLKELFVASLLIVARGGRGEDVPTDTTAAGSEHKPVNGSADGPSRLANGASSSEDKAIGTATDDIPPVTNGDSAQDAQAAITKPSEAETQPNAKSAPKAPAPKKRNLADVCIPEALQSNVVLRVLKQQAQVLLDEMDNTNVDDWPSDKLAGGPDGAPIPRMRRGRAMRAC